MPLILRVCTLVQETESRTECRHGAIAPVWLWVPLYTSTTTGAVIEHARQRVKTEVHTTLSTSPFSVISSRPLTFPRVVQESSEEVEEDTVWCLCCQDVQGQFRFCGDSSLFARTCLARMPFVADVAVQSQLRFAAEVARCGEAAVASSSSQDRSNDGGEGSEHQALVAALATIEGGNTKCAFLHAVLLPAQTLRQCNPQFLGGSSSSKRDARGEGGVGSREEARAVQLLDVVYIPVELSADPPLAARTTQQQQQVVNREKPLTLEHSVSTHLSVDTHPLHTGDHKVGGPSQDGLFKDTKLSGSSVQRSSSPLVASPPKVRSHDREAVASLRIKEEAVRRRLEAARLAYEAACARHDLHMEHITSLAPHPQARDSGRTGTEDKGEDRVATSADPELRALLERRLLLRQELVKCDDAAAACERLLGLIAVCEGEKRDAVARTKQLLQVVEARGG